MQDLGFPYRVAKRGAAVSEFTPAAETLALPETFQFNGTVYDTTQHLKDHWMLGLVRGRVSKKQSSDADGGC